MRNEDVVVSGKSSLDKLLLYAVLQFQSLLVLGEYQIVSAPSFLDFYRYFPIFRVFDRLVLSGLWQHLLGMLHTVDSASRRHLRISRQVLFVLENNENRGRRSPIVPFYTFLERGAQRFNVPT